MRKVLAANTWERKISHERSISTSLLGKLFEGRRGEHDTTAPVCVEVRWRGDNENRTTSARSLQRGDKFLFVSPFVTQSRVVAF